MQHLIRERADLTVMINIYKKPTQIWNKILQTDETKIMRREEYEEGTEEFIIQRISYHLSNVLEADL